MGLFSKTLTLPKTLAATSLTLTELPLPPRVILPLTQGIGEPARVCVAVEAIGAGRRDARSIHRYLSGQEISPPENAIRKDTSLPDVDELKLVARSERVKMPELGVDERRGSFDEVERASMRRWPAGRQTGASAVGSYVTGRRRVIRVNEDLSLQI